MDDSSQGYRSLKAWQKAMKLAETIYKLTAKLPDQERFGLVSQMQRAVVSIPCNISEGHGRSAKEFCRFFFMSRGSAHEIATQLELCIRLKYIDRESVIPAWRECQSIARMLYRLIQAIKKRRGDK